MAWMSSSSPGSQFWGVKQDLGYRQKQRLFYQCFWRDIHNLTSLVCIKSTFTCLLLRLAMLLVPSTASNLRGTERAASTLRSLLPCALRCCSVHRTALWIQFLNSPNFSYSQINSNLYKNTACHYYLPLPSLQVNSSTKSFPLLIPSFFSPGQ